MSITSQSSSRNNSLSFCMPIPPTFDPSKPSTSAAARAATTPASEMLALAHQAHQGQKGDRRPFIDINHLKEQAEKAYINNRGRDDADMQELYDLMKQADNMPAELVVNAITGEAETPISVKAVTVDEASTVKKLADLVCKLPDEVPEKKKALQERSKIEYQLNLAKKRLGIKS